VARGGCLGFVLGTSPGVLSAASGCTVSVRAVLLLRGSLRLAGVPPSATRALMSVMPTSGRISGRGAILGAGSHPIAPKVGLRR
jgi:hypothetical protein